MSILEYPRAYFRGEVAWDPVTTNNYPVDQAPAAYDEVDCDSTLNTGRVLNAQQVADFRQAAINEVGSAGNWNPAGSYRCPFFNTYVTGADLGSGLDMADAFASAPVSFTGMLVDCEPYGAFSSQLFFDDMSFGIQGGCRIYGRRTTRFNDRFINFQANPSNNMIAGVASVMWQSGFAKGAGLQIDAFDSKVLRQLQAAMADPDVLGLMVRFVTYRTVYYDNPTLSNGAPATAAAAANLQAMLDAGGFQPNPARSKLVGTIGLWRTGEVITEASDRALIATMATVPGQKPPVRGGPTVATAFARVNSNGIALDLSNAIPCSNRETDKFDLGTLTLTATDPPPAVAISELATIDFSQYTRAAYEATSGIVDIPLPSGILNQIAAMNLSLRNQDATFLVEDPVRAVPLTPNLYMDQGDQANLVVQVFDRGVPASAGVQVTMSDMNASQGAAVSARTNGAGQVSFALQGTSPEIIGWVFQTGDHPKLPLGNSFTPLNYTYAYQRVLPADDDIAQLPATWANVYQHVLANWQSMAPCMDNWLRLGDEQQVRAYAGLIKRLTDPANFESFRYMPVTRDMSRGQRTLLHRFLDASMASNAATVQPMSSATVAAGLRPPEAADPAQFSIQQLSRSMRSGPGRN